MEGNVLFANDAGWGCSNVSNLDYESEVVVSDKGEQSIKNTKIVEIMSPFVAVGSFKVGDFVDVAVAMSDSEIYSVTGKVSFFSEVRMVVLVDKEGIDCTDLLHNVENLTV